MAFPPADTTAIGAYYELSTDLIAREVMRRGHQPIWLRKAMFVIEVDGGLRGWNLTRCDITSTVGAQEGQPARLQAGRTASPNVALASFARLDSMRAIRGPSHRTRKVHR
jgi:hypothetical protein